MRLPPAANAAAFVSAAIVFTAGGSQHEHFGVLSASAALEPPAMVSKVANRLTAADIARVLGRADAGPEPQEAAEPDAPEATTAGDLDPGAATPPPLQPNLPTVPGLPPLPALPKMSPMPNVGLPNMEMPNVEMPNMELPNVELPTIDPASIEASVKDALPPAEFGGFQGPAGAVAAALGLRALVVEASLAKEQERLEAQLEEVSRTAAEEKEAMRRSLLIEAERADALAARVGAAEAEGARGARLQRALRERMEQAEAKIQKIDAPGAKIDAEMARKEAELFFAYNATVASLEAELEALPATRRELQAEVADFDKQIRTTEPKVRTTSLSEGLGAYLDMRQLQTSFKTLKEKRAAQAAALSSLGGRAAELKADLQAAKRSYRDESSEAMGKLRARRLAFDESVAEQMYDVTLALDELEAVEQLVEQAAQ